LREEPIGPSFNRLSVVVATSVSGDVLLSSFMNIDRRKEAFEEYSIGESLKRKLRGEGFLSLRARRLVPSTRIPGAT